MAKFITIIPTVCQTGPEGHNALEGQETEEPNPFLSQVRLQSLTCQLLVVNLIFFI